MDFVINLLRDFLLESWAGLAVQRSPGSHSDYTAIYRSALRRCPRWRSGHLLLAQAALSESNLELVQSSLVAAQTLGADKIPSQHEQMIFLRAKLAMRLGHYERAIELFNEVQQSKKLNRTDLYEELAAAHAAKGDKRKALEILRFIDPNKISMQARAVLELLEASLNNPQS